LFRRFLELNYNFYWAIVGDRHTIIYTSTVIDDALLDPQLWYRDAYVQLLTTEDIFVLPVNKYFD